MDLPLREKPVVNEPWTYMSNNIIRLNSNYKKKEKPEIILRKDLLAFNQIKDNTMSFLVPKHDINELIEELDDTCIILKRRYFVVNYNEIYDAVVDSRAYQYLDITLGEFVNIYKASLSKTNTFINSSSNWTKLKEDLKIFGVAVGGFGVPTISQTSQERLDAIYKNYSIPKNTMTTHHIGNGYHIIIPKITIESTTNRSSKSLLSKNKD